MSRANLNPLMDALGHRFKDSALLHQALTHPSAVGPSRPDYQRLEFLGDRVLGLVIAQALMKAFPNAPEGELAPRFNALVRRECLAERAEEIDLGKYLRLGRSESISGGRRKAAILADAMEAVIAAVYLDGGIRAARRFIHKRWGNVLKTADAAPIEPKSHLQEWAQGRGLPTPAYTLLSRKGPDHAPVFTVEVQLEDGKRGKGTARSKKLAEQAAAADLLKALGNG
ncbi:MAG: ribonuclease III [Pseudomonadota bacterium]